MPLIKVRKLDANGDPLMGSRQANFITNLDPVGQIISTTIKLFRAEFEQRLRGDAIKHSGFQFFVKLSREELPTGFYVAHVGRAEKVGGGQLEIAKRLSDEIGE